METKAEECSKIEEQPKTVFALKGTPRKEKKDGQCARSRSKAYKDGTIYNAEDLWRYSRAKDGY